MYVCTYVHYYIRREGRDIDKCSSVTRHWRTARILLNGDCSGKLQLSRSGTWSIFISRKKKHSGGSAEERGIVCVCFCVPGAAECRSGDDAPIVGLCWANP